MSRVRSDEEVARLTREVAARAIHRLDILEWLILLGAAAMAVAGGALLAWLLSPVLPLGFRAAWLVIALLLFVVPGAIALARSRREERERALISTEAEESDDG